MYNVLQSVNNSIDLLKFCNKSKTMNDNFIDFFKDFLLLCSTVLRILSLFLKLFVFMYISTEYGKTL